MPKESYVGFFLMTVAALGTLQFFVFGQLRRYIRVHFAEKANKLLPRFRWLFILMNAPVVLIYFRRQLASDLPTVTNIILYPYTVWVFLLVFWTVILLPIVVVRVLRRSVYK